MQDEEYRMIRRFAAAIWVPLLAVALPLFGPGAAAQAPAVQTLPDFADLADRAGPAVVTIRRTPRVGSNPPGALPFPDIAENDPMYEFFRRFFPNPPQQGPRQGPQQGPRRDVPRGLGSGFVIPPD